MKARERTPVLGLCFAIVCMAFAVSLYAQDEMPAEEVAAPNVQPDAPMVEDGPSDPLPLGAVTPWTRFGEDYAEGLVDVLIPLYYHDGLFLFTNVRSAFSDVSEEELNIGFGLRKQLDTCDTILGLNAFYDSRWTEENNQFNQVGFGVEMLSTWLDVRANGYIPENDKELLGTEESTALTSSSTRTSVSAFAEGNTIIEQTVRETTSTFTTSAFSIYEVPLEGYDVEIGVKLPLPGDSVEARLFGGYYSFEPVWEGNVADDNDIDGFKGRAEVRINDTFLLDAEVFEDDRLFGSDYLISARVRLPFDVSAISRGENPFKASREEDAGFSSRLSDMVMRDPHIQIRSETSVVTSISEETIIRRRNELALGDVIFVDGDNVGDPAENGSAENPFDIIQEGVDESALRAYPNVVVLTSGTPYTENVRVENDINLLGTGAGFGDSGVLLDGGVAPIVAGGGDDDFIIHFEEAGTVLVRGFTFDGIPFGGGSAPLGALDFVDVLDVTVTQNTFQNLGTGVTAMMSDSLSSDFQMVVTNNDFLRNGVAVAGMLGTPGDFQVLDNRIDGSLIGVLALGLDTTGRPRTLIADNQISYTEPLTPGALEDIDFLLSGLFGPLPDDLPLPMIGGVVVGAIEGELDAEIHNNTIQGPLLGITGLSLDLFSSSTYLNFSATGNSVSGGGLDETIGLILDSGALDFILGPITSDDFSLGYEAGLAGITVIGIGPGSHANEFLIQDNYVENTFLGVNAISVGVSAMNNGSIHNNQLVDNGLGITAIGLLDGQLNDLMITDNLVDGGGLPKLFEAFGPTPFPIPDVSFAGITLLGFETDAMQDIVIRGNQVQDHFLGVTALGLGVANLEGLTIENNTLSDNLSGVLLVGLGLDANLSNAVIDGNTIDGAGGAFIGDLVGLLLDDDIPIPDVGLAGVTLLSVGDANLNNFQITQNDISEQMIGIMAVGLYDGTADNGLIFGNTVSHGAIGILGAGVDGGSVNDLTIIGNTVTGIGIELGSGIPLGPITLFTDKAAIGIGVYANDGDALDASVTGNTIENHEVGILSMEVDTGDNTGFSESGNSHTDNTADLVEID